MKNVTREGVLLFLAAVLFLQTASGEESAARLAVEYFPQAAYKNERATFVVSGRTGVEISVKFGGKVIASQVSRGQPLEFNLELGEGGTLSFLQGADDIRFRVVRPEEEMSMTDRDGYLFAGKDPVILLADHLHPPKHDRRWETVSFFRRMFGDPRPQASSGTILYSDALRGEKPDAAKDPGFWKHVTVPVGISEINAYVSTTNATRGGDLFALVLSDADMERGVKDLELRVKLEWFLQRVSGSGVKYMFVVCPDLNDQQIDQFGSLLAGLRIAAGGNKARFITFPPRRETKSTPKEWLEAIERDIEKRVKCR